MNSVHRIVRASAGTGKTYQLSSRYLWLLARGVRPSEILATTFTRKAAGEILERVVRRLVEAAKSEAAAKKLGQDLGLQKPLSQEYAQKLLGELCRNIGRWSISTIDAFFNHIAQSFRYELGLPLQVQLVDANDALARQMRQEALEAVLADEDLQTLVELLRRLHRQKIRRSVSQTIDRLVQELYEVYCQAPHEKLWSKLHAPKEARDETWASKLIAQLREMGHRLPLTQAGTPHRTWAKAFKRLNETLAARNWQEVLQDTLIANLETGTFSGYAYPKVWWNILEEIAECAEAKVRLDLQQQTRAMFELLRRFDRHFQRMKHRYRLMLFSDLSLILAEQGLTSARQEELFYRLDRQIRHLLLDEFQDTSLEQWKVLEPLARRIVTGEEGRTFFCVGDGKQSIYGWRGGCSELFAQVQQRLGLEARSVQSLHESFRSSPAVLETVNRVFSRLTEFPPLRPCRKTAEQWLSHFQKHQAHFPDMPGYVELRSSCGKPSEEESEESSPEEWEDDETADGSTAGFDPHLAFVAEQVQKLTRESPGKSLGVLVRRNRTVRRLVFALRRLGVASSGEGGNPLTDDPAVNAVLAAIRLADHPGDTVAGFHVHQSPLGAVVGLNEWSRKALGRLSEKIRRDLLTRGYAAVIWEWVRALRDSCSERSMARLMQLVELADRYEPNVSLRPGDFLRYVQSTEVEEPLSATVRVMTVHKAKGLEFDIVVLAELHQPMGQVRNNSVYVVRPSPTEPVCAVYAACPKEIRTRIPELEEAFSQEQARRFIDDLSALYVAMTRARHALYMFVPPLERKKTGEPKKKGWEDLSPAALLRFTLGSGEPDFEPGQVLFNQGDPTWAKKVAAETVEEVPAAEPLKIHLAPPEPGWRSWGQISPSAMEHGGWVDPKDLLAIEEHAGRRMGTLVHALLAQVGWVDDPEGMPSDEQLQNTARKIGMYAAAANAAPVVDIQAFRELLNKPGIRRLLSRPRVEKGQELELWRERRFAVQMDGRLLVGQFDRVVIERIDGHAVRAHLMDFKTDQISDEPEQLETLVERYRPQIQAYRRALAKMLNLEEKAIRATLVFVGPDRAVDIPPQEPAEIDHSGGKPSRRTPAGREPT